MARDLAQLHGELVAQIPQIRRFALALSRRPADADDLVQATVERVLSRPVPDDAELGKWMVRICRNLWIDEIRSRKVRSAAAPDLAESENLSASAEATAIGRMQMQKAQAGIENLPIDQREVLALVAIGGMAYREAADLLSVPVGTVMSRLARARAALAAYLEAPA
jgi:RNA polymerase sigma factor (sigma-70 family)